MNLHLCLDGNFIQQAIDAFEQFYPKDNLFIMFNTSKKGKYRDDIFLYRYELDDPDILMKIQHICYRYTIKHVVIHALVSLYYPILIQLKEKKLYDGQVFWIFWGYELYNALGEIGTYKLIDNMSIFSWLTYIAPTPLSRIIKKVLGKNLRSEYLKKSLPYIDYFCTWFSYDFELLNKYFDSNLKFKYFKYLSPYKDTVQNDKISFCSKEKDLIMVNHQASLTGNYITLFRKLKSLKGIEDFTICTPLSYGSKYIRKNVLRLGKRDFGLKYVPLLKLFPVDEYNKFLDSIPVAIFGALRQEAAGNIMRLLRSGTKVFLRDGNPLLSYYREKGFIIFSFERDLNSLEDLQPLSQEQQLCNMKTAIDTQIFYEDYMPTFFD